ncbi:hypothetical protein BC629DRAFT_1465552 [Irpex lacteus]|nr:hypothetical protein BC629DRAFT_1465552 [Irpex lacteus]
MPITTGSVVAPSCSVDLTSFNGLSIIAVMFSVLSALFGVYVVLFIFAVWSTYRRLGPAYRTLRIITIVLFIDLVIHYVCRSITMAQSRAITHAADEERMVTILYLTCTFAGFVSDGLLAWRFYIVYGRKRWAKYIPATPYDSLVLLKRTLIPCLVLGFSGDFQHFTFYHSTWLYTIAFKIDSLKINLAWGWFTFTINTVLSGAIIGKIIHVSRDTNKYNSGAGPAYIGGRYNTALAAVVESALITWIGLLLYLIAALAPTGRITVSGIIHYIFFHTHRFFGISQCLITTRLGLAKDALGRDSRIVAEMVLGADNQESTKGVVITVSRDTETDAEKGNATWTRQKSQTSLTKVS